MAKVLCCLLQGLPRYLCLALVAGACTPAWLHASEGNPPHPRVGLAGGDHILWVSHRRLTDQGLQLTMALRPPGSQVFVGPARLRDIGAVLMAAETVGDELHVFYPRSHRRYGLAGTRVQESTETPLLEAPLGLAHDQARPSLVALISSTSAERVQQLQLQRVMEEQPDQAGLPAGTQSFELFQQDDDSLFLARYAGGRWELEARLPSSLSAAKRNLLLADQSGRIHVLLESEGQWVSAVHSPSGWSEPRSQPTAGLSAVGLIASQGQPGLVAWRAGASGPELTILWSAGDDWGAPNDVPLPEWPARSRVKELAAVQAGGQLAVVGVDDRQLVFVSFCSLGGEPFCQPWAEISALRGSPSRGVGAEIQSLLAFVMLGGMLGYVFWRRQDSITRELELPAPYRLAGYARRLVGFCLDVALTLGPTRQWWWPRLEAWIDSYDLVALETGQPPSISTSLVAAWLLVCVAYVAFASVCEAWFGTTPGKAIVHCRAVSETGHRMQLRQVLVRNILRTVELFPAFMLFPPFILILFTRNRQRLGDLMARTVVVERVHPNRRRASGQTSDQGRDRERRPDDEDEK